MDSRGLSHDPGTWSEVKLNNATMKTRKNSCGDFRWLYDGNVLLRGRRLEAIVQCYSVYMTNCSLLQKKDNVYDWAGMQICSYDHCSLVFLEMFSDIINGILGEFSVSRRTVQI